MSRSAGDTASGGRGVTEDGGVSIAVSPNNKQHSQSRTSPANTTGHTDSKQYKIKK